MKHVKMTVFWNFLALLMNIVFIASITSLIGMMLRADIIIEKIIFLLAVILGAAILRAWMEKKSAESAYYASCDVKKRIRYEIYQKMMKLGLTYQQQCSTSEVVQVAMEGADQLEIYFGKYLPQLFTSLLAPFTLFLILIFVDYRAALVLLICVPLIPISIIAVQKIAKKLLAKYWKVYTGLGDGFLENLQGLTTLKIYQADEERTRKMDEDAENFRKITMKVLIMQLNSISIMDMVAYGGAAAGIIMALYDVKAGLLGFEGCLLIILLAAEFFIPLRLLGSFFHIAMNGMAASDKIFKLLDLPEKQVKEKEISTEAVYQLRNVSFSYNTERMILDDISLDIPFGSFTAFAGVSGSGKSTLAKLLCGTLDVLGGSLCINGIDVSELNISSLITSVSHNDHLFKGTVRYNLEMAKVCTDEKMWEVLERVKLKAFVEENGGLEMMLKEGASNLSGGQRQRLNLARALLRDTPVYLFDEATSNIDIDSENDILKVIKELRSDHTVIMISHRLDYCKECDRIYYLEEGRIKESGTHEELLRNNQGYARLIHQQEELLAFSKGGLLRCEEVV